MLPIQARIVIAEGRSLYREGLAALLHAEADFEVVGECEDAERARWVCGRVQPDLILLQAALPNAAEPDGLSVIACLRAGCPYARIVVIGAAEEIAEATGKEREALIQAERGRALHAGAAGYLLPTADRLELFRILRSVLSEAGVEPVGMDGNTARSAARDHITERERAVITLIAQGMCNKEVAHRLGIGTQTVKNHVCRLLEKLALADRTQLAIYAIEHHLTPGTGETTLP